MEGFLLESLSCRMPAAAAGRHVGGQCPSRHPGRTDRRPRPVQHGTAQRPRRHHPHAPGPAARRRRQISYGDRSGQATGAPAAHPPRTAPQSPGTYPWRLNITATVFWVGEDATERNPVANHKSSWDSAWKESFGGFDNPDPLHRTMDFGPRLSSPGRIPFMWPFPTTTSARGAQAGGLPRHPLVPPKFSGKGQSVCKGRWVQIIYNKRSCFCPMGGLRPVHHGRTGPTSLATSPRQHAQQGSRNRHFPAVRDYLGIPGGTAIVHWRFVEFYRIPAAPGPSGETTTPLSIPIWVRAKGPPDQGRSPAPAAGSHPEGIDERPRKT